MLAIPAPQVTGPSAPLVQPFVLTVAGVMNDGAPATAEELASVGVLAFRGSPSAAELWDDALKVWRPSPPDAELVGAKALVGAPAAGASPSWQATLVAIGQKDAAGAPVFAAAAAGAPSYFARALVTARSGEAGVGAPSAPFTFVDTTKNSRFATEFDTPATAPEAAHRVRLQLKSDTLQPAGYLEIRALPALEVELSSCDATGRVVAKVLLAGSGEIRLSPGPGARVIIDGDVEAERVFYSPSAGGGKVWLP